MDKRFENIFAISSTNPMPALPEVMAMHTSFKDIKFLVSLADDSLQRGSTIKNIFRNLLQENTILDSGGYSIATGVAHPENLTPNVYVEVITSQKPLYCIGPDFPIYSQYEGQNAQVQELLFRLSLKLSKERAKIFYLEIGDQKHTKIYEAIHGLVYFGNKYTLDFRSRWYDAIKIGTYDSHNGIALPGLQYIPLKAVAYFGMQPWSESEKRVHFLGLGSVSSLALFTYMNQACYEKVTCDSTTYTIKVMKYPKLFLDDEFGWVKSFSLDPKRYNGNTTFDKCECPLCAYYYLEYEYPISKDAIDYKNENLNAGSRLRHRVIPHNVFLIRKFQEKLSSILKTGRSNFIDFLKTAKQEDVIEAIDLVDHVINEGPQNYGKNLKLLND